MIDRIERERERERERKKRRPHARTSANEASLELLLLQEMVEEL